MKQKCNLTGRELLRHIRPDLLKFGVILAAGPEMAHARDLAARLIGCEIVSAAALDRVQTYTETAVWVAHEAGDIAGVMAFVPLSATGADAVLRGAFDAVNPAIEHMAGPDEVVCGSYGWGIAASTKTAARRVVDGSFEIIPHFEHLPRFARPTTEAGHRLMRERMGYSDLAGSDGLVWLPPVEQRQAAVAA